MLMLQGNTYAMYFNTEFYRQYIACFLAYYFEHVFVG